MELLVVFPQFLYREHACDDYSESLNEAVQSKSPFGIFNLVNRFPQVLSLGLRRVVAVGVCGAKARLGVVICFVCWGRGICFMRSLYQVVVESGEVWDCEEGFEILKLWGGVLSLGRTWQRVFLRDFLMKDTL